ncbi:MAG: DUF1501 domain-containing protein [Pirellulaceae bacterium]|nr:DUF1501 domain-containing protein [Pirellulaceae bacterium]
MSKFNGRQFMLTLLGNQFERGFCDGLSRRGFLRIGTAGFGVAAGSNIGLNHILADQDARQSDRSLIMIYLPGGPTQHETFDPKGTAPREIRGHFSPCQTTVPGVHFCELLPKLSASFDRFSVIRSLTGMLNRHESFQCYTGRPGGRAGDQEPAGGWPTIGSVVSTLSDHRARPVPAYADVSPKMSYQPYNNKGLHDASGQSSWPGFTGSEHTPFAVEGEIRRDLILQGVDLDRLNQRALLLRSLVDFQPHIGNQNLTKFQNQAFGTLTNCRLADALDLALEPERVRLRYGPDQTTHASFGGAIQSGQRLLMARRLIEAGVRCVTVALGAWDWHANREGPIHKLSKKYLPVFDNAVSTLLQDLQERGMLDRTTVIALGEFGRTPRINPKGGRDHWPSTQSILLAGGGIQGGRILGQTDRQGGVPVDRPVHIQEVFATLYRNLGIDVSNTKINDLAGRPRYLVEDGRQPISELY